MESSMLYDICDALLNRENDEKKLQLDTATQILPRLYLLPPSMQNRVLERIESLVRKLKDAGNYEPWSFFLYEMEEMFGFEGEELDEKEGFKEQPELCLKVKALFTL
jgi:hypothetical protein